MGSFSRIGSGAEGDLIESRLDFRASGLGLPGRGVEGPDMEEMEGRFLSVGVDGERVMMRRGESEPWDEGVGERP